MRGRRGRLPGRGHPPRGWGGRRARVPATPAGSPPPAVVPAATGVVFHTEDGTFCSRYLAPFESVADLPSPLDLRRSAHDECHVCTNVLKPCHLARTKGANNSQLHRPGPPKWATRRETAGTKASRPTARPNHSRNHRHRQLTMARSSSACRAVNNRHRPSAEVTEPFSWPAGRPSDPGLPASLGGRWYR
jgi:hypothetical protein